MEAYLDGVEQPELSAMGVAKVRVPELQGLERIHKGTIVAVRRGRDKASRQYDK